MLSILMLSSLINFCLQTCQPISCLCCLHVMYLAVVSTGRLQYKGSSNSLWWPKKSLWLSTHHINNTFPWNLMNETHSAANVGQYKLHGCMLNAILHYATDIVVGKIPKLAWSRTKSVTNACRIFLTKYSVLSISLSNNNVKQCTCL